MEGVADHQVEDQNPTHGVHDAGHSAGLTIVLESRVTAPTLANTLPSTVAPIVSVMD